jgi:hypothetical protein
VRASAAPGEEPRFQQRGHRRARCLAVIGLLAVAVGCAGPAATGESPGSEALAGAPDPALLAEVVASHNERVHLLQRTYSSGVLEYRWVDEHGESHSEPQVDAKLWLDLPWRTALRAEKLGDVLFWLGSNDTQYWMFDLLSEPSVLLLGDQDDPVAPPGLLVRPLALLDLLGLSTLPEPAQLVARYADGDREHLVLEGRGAGGPMRVMFGAMHLPERVEVLDEQGEIALSSSLAEYRSVIVEGISRAALPRMPGRIDITDTAGTMSVKLALGKTSTDPASDAWKVVFDLERLKQSMPPEEVRRAEDQR